MDEENRLSELEQNKRDHKVEFTDIAISKVPFVKYRSIPESHYSVLQELAKEVLRVSRDENNCNEVAITYDLDSPELAVKGGKFVAVVKGNEHSVDPLADTDANHMYMSAKGCVIIITHNHPGLSSEEPDALDGALEWLDAEIEKEEENNLLSKQVEDHIRPLVMEIAEKNGSVVTK